MGKTRKEKRWAEEGLANFVSPVRPTRCSKIGQWEKESPKSGLALSLKPMGRWKGVSHQERGGGDSRRDRKKEMRKTMHLGLLIDDKMLSTTHGGKEAL